MPSSRPYTPPAGLSDVRAAERFRTRMRAMHPERQMQTCLPVTNAELEHAAPMLEQCDLGPRRTSRR